MDYEVFMLSRIREEYDLTGSTETAVVTELGGAVVSSPALPSPRASPSWRWPALPEPTSGGGTALGFGILLDATVVRALLVPALVSLLGHWNWWFPVPMARLSRVPASPLSPATRA